MVNSIVGPDRLSRLDVVMAGDDVTKKKPDPLIYNLAGEKVGLPSSKCVVIEDSLVGLRAAMGANMPCVITPCPSSDVPDFRAHGARAVMDVNVGLGDGAGAVVTSQSSSRKTRPSPTLTLGADTDRPDTDRPEASPEVPVRIPFLLRPNASPAAPTAWCTIPISSTRTRTSDRGERRIGTRVTIVGGGSSQLTRVNAREERAVRGV